MRRLPVQVLLLGCAGMLLGVPGCWNRTAKIAVVDDSIAGEVAVQGKEKPTGPDAPFRLPDDPAGTLLARVLPPTARPGALDNPVRPAHPVVPPPRLDEPGMDLPAVMPDLPRLPEVVKRTPARPEFVLEEALEESFLMPDVPTRPAFVTGERTKITSPDAAVPPPLPILARPLPDRVSLDDATMEISTSAALKAALPERGVPAPYQRMTVPEPFENRRPLTLSVPEEVSVPASEGPRPPK